MTILQTLPALELLFFNLASIDLCCHRKYSRWKTALILAVFSVGLLAFCLAFAEDISFRADGRMSLFGLIYMIPLHYLYRDKFPILFTVTCTCWVYTLGILALSFQFSLIWMSGSLTGILLAENLLYLVTFLPFYRLVIPKYIFVVEHIGRFEKNWHKYIFLNTCLNFLTLVVLVNVFLSQDPSPVNILALLLLLSTFYVSNFILHKVVQDAIRLGQIEREVTHDPLTGLCNRAGLWDRLNTLLEGNETFSVLFMDLDRFKSVNDQYGHLVGDAYLKHFADVSSGILAEQGTVYRFGGDEFVAIYYGAVPENVLGELRECRPWADGAPCPFYQVSVGSIICRPPHEDNVETLLHKVDQMMYEQKINKHQKGGN